jgi:hypothetical protein
MKLFLGHITELAPAAQAPDEAVRGAAVLVRSKRPA